MSDTLPPEAAPFDTADPHPSSGADRFEPEVVIARLRRRLWIERGLFLATLLVLAGVWLYPIVFPSVWAVYVDNRPLVALRDREAMLAVLEEVKREGAGTAVGVTFLQAVRVGSINPSRVEVTDAHTAAERLAAIVKLKAPRGVIYVDGQAVVALPDEAQANAVLEEIKSAFATTLDSVDAPPSFAQKVEVRAEPAEQEAWADKETALGLLRGEEAAEGNQHTVKRGETAVGIAEQYELTADELARLNPKVDIKHLRPGVKLEVSPADPPLLTVVTEGRSTETLPTPFTTVTKTSPKLYVGKRIVKRPGKPGKQRITYRVRCENGQVVHRDVMERTPLSPAREQVVVVGGKPRPRG